MIQDQKGQFSLRLIQRCPVCNGDYTESRLEILDEDEKSFLVYMSCGFCSSSLIVRVVTLPHGLIGNAILTDLSAPEVLSYSDSPTVLGNHVLEIHELINKDSSFMEKMRRN